MSQAMIARAVAAALIVGVAAATWDVWWHAAVGRDSFGIPPHLLLYVATACAVGFGIYGWHRYREAVWKRLAIVLILVPLSAPFDELWHRLYGVEDIASLAITWSPPHLMLITAIVASIASILPILKRDPDGPAQRFLGSFLFGSLLTILSFVASPFHPLGIHSLLGFFGAGIIAIVLATILAIGQKWLAGFAGATWIALTFFLFHAIGMHGALVARSFPVPPHPHVPLWLYACALVLAGIVLDYPARYPLYVRTMLSAVVWSFILFGFAPAFIEPAFSYSAGSTLEAVVASGVGGMLVGIMLSRL